jgi:hypothetical protein
MQAKSNQAKIGLGKKKGPARDRPSPDSPFKQSGNYPFVTIGGGGMLVQPAMLRSESTATSARAIFIAEPSLVMTRNTYRRSAWSSSAEKPHCGADFSGANTLVGGNFVPRLLPNCRQY